MKMKKEQEHVSFEEIPGSEFNIPCELALLAMGFAGPEKQGMLEKLGVELTDRGNVDRDKKLDDQCPWSVYCRRYAARTVTNCLGDRRRSVSCQGDRCVFDG